MGGEAELGRVCEHALQTLSGADAQGAALAILELVEDTWDRQVVLYVGDDWERRYPVRDRLDRALWHSRFLGRPNVDNWAIWQIHGFAHVEGISDGVDLNIMRPLE